jgi:bile acid:Na+ symporter, BASS family
VNIYQIAAMIMLVSLMLSTGLQCDRKALMTVLKDYGLLSRALLANFVIVPLFGVGLVRLFQLDGGVATGFLLMAIAAGAPFLTRSAGAKSGGSMGFAIALAFIMPAVCIVTVPITAQLVLAPGADAQLPFWPFALKLVALQLVPLLVGLWIADSSTTLAAKLRMPLTVLLYAAILVLLVHLVPALFKSVAAVWGSHGIDAMLVIVPLSIATGWLLGGPQTDYRHTLSIATGIRNTGLCILVATTSFPSSIVGATVLTFFLVQFVMGFAFRAILHRTAPRAAAPSPGLT